MQIKDGFKAGYVGLIGMPNAGKSTLANALVGEKISIVSKKAQTTRNRLLGIISEEDYQMILVDAPGVINSKTGMNGFLIGEYKNVIEQSDVLVAVLNTDANSEEGIDKILRIVSQSGKKWVAAVTKEDLNLLHRIEKIRIKVQELGGEFIVVSALKRIPSCREKFFDKVAPLLPLSPAPLYDTESYTTSSAKDMCSEIIREKCFKFLHEEIPYGIAVQVREYREEENIHRIFADIILEKEAHKGIVIGKKGVSLARITKEARLEMEELLDIKVFLDCHIKIKDKWTRNGAFMQELGYVVQRN